MVELLTDAEMANIVFLAIQQYKGNENRIATNIVGSVIKQILKKEVHIDDTQDICDIVFDCFDLYNAFVKEKNIQAPLIDDSSYDLIVDILNNIVGEMINGS